MKLSDIGELVLLESIRKNFRGAAKEILVGIGDDAAVVKWGKGNFLATTDMMIEDIHFDLSYFTPYQLGFKLISVNVSDIYAMGGRPRYALLAIALPGSARSDFADLFFEGVKSALNLYGGTLIGGDISSTKERISLSATLIGDGKSVVTRSGARPGERIYVTGSTGDAACGLTLLRRLKKPVNFTIKGGRPVSGEVLRFRGRCGKLSQEILLPLLIRHLMPVARDGRKFVGSATSMIDVSDGLLIDLSRICDESGVGARIYERLIPLSEGLREVSRCLGRSAVQTALSGGEDYELLFTAPAGKRVKGIYIGDITESERVIVEESGKETSLVAAGYQHFKSGDE